MKKTSIDFVVGIDNGTQALSVLFVSLKGAVLATGEHPVPMIAGLNGEREHDPAAWKIALREAMKRAYEKAKELGIELGECLGVCPSGQMHGEGILFSDGTFHDRVRLWCDARNKAEAQRLSELFRINIPQRLTIARWLWTIMNRPHLAKRCVGLTTPAGVIAKLLNNNAQSLGLGEARGMFPIDPKTLQYDADMAAKFDALTTETGVRPILELLPPPVPVGTIVGYVGSAGAELTGLPVGTPIMSPEGDQPTTLAGTYVSESGAFAFSGGTSICANLITDRIFSGIHPGVEPFMTVDGKEFLMCHVQNGTSFMNILVGLFGQLFDGDPFKALMPLAANAPTDCGGIIILPLAEAEHGLSFADLAHSGILNVTKDNATPGNLIRAAFMGSMFSIRYSVEAMREQGIWAEEIIASGGIVKSDWIAQAIADIFNSPVRILGEAEEGSAYGAALIALYGHKIANARSRRITWGQFLKLMKPKKSTLFNPQSRSVRKCEVMFQAFCALLPIEKVLNEIKWT